MYNITRGNVAPLRATLTFDDEPFMVVNAEDVEVALQSCFKRYVVEDFAIDADAGNVIYIQVPSTLPIGTYGLEVKGTLNNNGWRTFVKCVLDVTFATVRGDEEPVTPTSDYYDVTMEVQLYSYAADVGIIRHNEDPLAHPAIRELIPNKDYVLYKGAIWPEEYSIPDNPTSSERKYLLDMGSIVDYVEEKVPWDIVSDPSYVHTDNNFTDALRDKLSLLPNSNSLNTLLNGKVDKVYGKGLSTNDYTTAEKQKLSTLHNYDDTSIRWLIQNVQDSLVNYYTKSETYSRSQVDALVASIPGMEIVSVDTLPRASSSTMNKIYLVPRAEERNNIKYEYITIQEGGNYAWELIGSTDVDLTGYLKDTDVAAVALSGSYNDLEDKPTIPSEVTESTVAGWGFTKNTGTITGITMNGASKGTSGVVDLGTVVTDVSGKVDKTTTINGKALSSNVTLTASEVGALPSTTVIPTITFRQW